VAWATFPLIWMGGFVTTYRAGMAVPDWPSTFGYNMFLYPVESWLKVFDVFLEHSHRLIAASVGMLTIGLAVALWLGDHRRWIRWLGLIAVVGVSSQGVLGGLRVWFDERLLAKIHGCTAPLFFALTASLVTLTSGAWRTWAAGGETPPPSRHGRGAGGEGRLALAVAIAVYVQIVAGAQLRHLTPHEQTFWFALWVWIHVIVAGLLLLGSVWIAIRPRAGWHAQSLRWAWLRPSTRSPRPSQSLRACHPRLVRRARLLAGLMLLQLVLGAATWLTNYGVPVWFSEYVWELDYTVVASGAWQAVLTTAHVAVASLVLVTAISLALWSSRVSKVETEAHGSE
jgi:cytochrome c oxidase assembly protein subunit 15